MTLICVFSPTSPAILPRSHGVEVDYNFSIRSTVPVGNLGLNLSANNFGANDELDTFQDNQLKNYYPVEVPFPILYTIELCLEG